MNCEHYPLYIYTVYKEREKLRLVGFHLMHCADDQMLEIYQVIGEMTLKSIISALYITHAKPELAWPWFRILNSLSGTVCLPKFCRIYQCSNASDKIPKIVDFSLYIQYHLLCDKSCSWWELKHKTIVEQWARVGARDTQCHRWYSLALSVHNLIYF